MDIIVNSFLNMLQPIIFIGIIFGVSWGIFMGALPGFGAAIGIALLIPFTYGMNPIVALPILAGVYTGAYYGGGITSIMIGVPGNSPAAATIMDGFPMTQKGQSQKALTTSLISSVFGGIFGGFALLLLAPKLVQIILLFGPAEYFVLAVFGLTIIASLSGASIMKGLISGTFGLLLSTIGVDVITGDSRFTFGEIYLFDGIPIIPLILGLFAFPRCLIMIRDIFLKKSLTLSLSDEKGSGTNVTLKEMLGMWKTVVRSSIIGTIIGMIPGAGANIACWVGYGEAKRNSKHPEKFGTGIPEGVAAAEAANNSVAGGSMIPLLTLGIPGNSASAVMLVALMIHGLVPGLKLFETYSSITYTYMVAMIFSCFILLAIGWYTSRIFAKLATINFLILVPTIVMVTLIGSFSSRQYVFDIWVTLFLGIFCYWLTLLKYPMPPILLGVILGPISEKGLRRALMISGGDWTIFITRPICIIMLILSVISVYYGLKISRNNIGKGMKKKEKLKV